MIDLLVGKNISYFTEWKQEHMEFINKISELEHILYGYNLEEVQKLRK